MTPEGSETILLVEDEVPVRALIRAFLERAGYTVVEEATADAALARVDRHDGPIHLLITDVVMPGLSGPDLARRLVALKPEARVLFMSGYSDTVISERYLLPPGSKLLEKPFTAEGLLLRVRLTLDAPPRLTPSPERRREWRRTILALKNLQEK